MVSFAYLSLPWALFVCLLFALMFVISIYLADVGLPRDHPTTIHRRSTAVCIVCFLSALVLWLLARRDKGGKTLLALMGLRWGLGELVLAVLVSIILVALLFLGPIVQDLLSPDKGAGLLEPLKKQSRDVVIRNYVVAPLAEELVFRSCMFPLLLPKLGQVWTAFVCPLFFGLAHLHHSVGLVRTGAMTPFQAVLSTLFQAAYTTLFGMFSGVLLIRTGHLVSAILAHALCNLIGLPDFYGITEHKKPVVVSAAYVAGLVGFLYLLFPLTSPRLFSGY